MDYDVRKAYKSVVLGHNTEWIWILTVGEFKKYIMIVCDQREDR